MNQIEQFNPWSHFHVPNNFDEEVADEVGVAILQQFGEGFTVEKRNDNPNTLNVDSFNRIWFKLRHEVGVEWNVFTWSVDFRSRITEKWSQKTNPIVREISFQFCSWPVNSTDKTPRLTRIGEIRWDKTITVNAKVSSDYTSSGHNIFTDVIREIEARSRKVATNAFIDQQIKLFKQTTKLKLSTVGFNVSDTVRPKYKPIKGDISLQLLLSDDNDKRDGIFHADIVPTKCQFIVFCVPNEPISPLTLLPVLSQVANIGLDNFTFDSTGKCRLSGSAEKIGSAVSIINANLSVSWESKP